jgi:hypothetical protein
VESTRVVLGGNCSTGVQWQGRARLYKWELAHILSYQNIAAYMLHGLSDIKLPGMLHFKPYNCNRVALGGRKLFAASVCFCLYMIWLLCNLTMQKLLENTHKNLSRERVWVDIAF